MQFYDFQEKCTLHPTTRTPNPRFYAYSGLVEEVGELSKIFKRGSRKGYEMAAIAAMHRDEIVDECGDILWYLARFLKECGATLEEAAAVNLEKMSGRRAKMQGQ